MAISSENVMPSVLCKTVAIAEAPVDTLESLVREHGRLVYRVAYSALHNPEDAEDVAQETFLRLLSQRPEWPRIRDMRAWLARVAWRLAAGRQHLSCRLSATEPFPGSTGKAN
jgi:DNA-directed RNA polymerase specialized sigma24 family protein